MDVEFVPLVMESWGTLGRKLALFIKEVWEQRPVEDNDQPRNWAAPNFVTYWRQRISVAAQRGVAELCLRRARGLRGQRLR